MATQDQKVLADGIAKYQQFDKDKQKVIGLIKQLDVQLNENSAVKEVNIFSGQTEQFSLSIWLSGTWLIG